MTSQRVERTWIRTGGYGRFRGEWVKVDDRLMIVYVAINFLLCFFIYSLAYINIPKNNGKREIKTDKKLTTTHTYRFHAPWSLPRESSREFSPVVTS